MGLNLFIGPGFLCLIGGFALLPDTLLAEFINKRIKREKLGLAQTMPYRRDFLICGCLTAGFDCNFKDCIDTLKNMIES